MTKLEKTFTWETKSDLVVIINTENTPVAIVGWDKTDSQLKLKLDIEEDVENLNDEDFCRDIYDEEKNQLELTLAVPQYRGTNRISVNLYVPKVTEVIAKSQNGPVSIKHLHGIQTVESTNGPISLSNIDGDIEIKSKNGPVSVKTVKGNQLLEVVNGPIKVSESDGILTINQNNGPVKLIKCKGELKVNGENGSIKVLKSGFENSNLTNKNGQVLYEFSNENKGNYQMKTAFGRINLVIPSELEFDLEGKTKMGSFKIGIDGDYQQGLEDDYKTLEMVKGAGNASIKVETNKGAIILTDKQNIKTNFPNINFDHLIDGVMDFIPEDKLEKVTESMEKLKERLKSIDFPDIENKIEISVKKIEETLQNELNKESHKQAFAKMKSNIHQAAEKVQDKFRSNSQPCESDLQDKKESRLKILQLLENGKISVEQAEKLLKAVENE